MAIYTRTGDDGSTGLFGGKRLSKADDQIEAYGSLDELTSTLGVLTYYIDKKGDIHFIQEVQQDLYIIMGFLAGAPTQLKTQKDKIILFEKKIDLLTGKLPQLKNFILPGGTLSSCWAHMARVSCRKAERTIILFFEKNAMMKLEESQTVLKYLNRLSDLLFTYARVFNEGKDIIPKKI